MIDTMKGLLIRHSRKETVLKEMINYSIPEEEASIREAVYRECLEREKAATTVVEKGLAFPHAKMQTIEHPVICTGYSKKGVVWDSSGEIVHIIVLLICHEDDHLANLAELASMIQVPGVQEKLSEVNTPESIIRILREAKEFRQKRIPHKKEKMTHTLVRQVGTLLKESPDARALVYSNTPSRIIKLMGEIGPTTLSLVTNQPDLRKKLTPCSNRLDEIYQVEGNLSDEIHVLRELWTKEKLKEGEIIISISGFEHDDVPHRISISSIPWDLYNESRLRSYQIPHNVNMDILSRVIYLASELSRQGREGKAVGTIFVVGEYEKVEPFCKQLIINPFGGLKEQNRSILDPSLSETIKEFSKIDGAFIIGNDGQIHSAGTYLSIPPGGGELPSGLGARHAAARGITIAAPVASAVISESTGSIRIFWDGIEQDKYN